MEGQVVLKVTTPFTNIQTENGIVSTNESWFNSIAQQYQIRELRSIFYTTEGDFEKYYLVVFDSSYTVDAVINTLESEPGVIFAEPDYIFQIFSNPNDPFFDLQWSLAKIQADLAWNIESGNASVIVGVIDTGTDLLRDDGNPHPDLINNLWNENGKYGFNARDTLQLPDDDNGHGTHVAGIIGAETNNSTGIAGMAGGGFGGDDGIRIMSVKGLRISGGGFAAELANGIVWAANHGADIINMSWGRETDCCPSSVILAAIQHADSLGVVLVAAAGNGHYDLEFIGVYPAEYEEVIAVAGTDTNDLLSPVSNFGSTIEVCAPAGKSLYPQITDNVYSTTPFEPGFYLNQNQGVPHQYAYPGGTSTSAAFVSGLAALLKSYDNTLTSNEIRNIITGTVDPVEEQFHEQLAGKLGAGRINAYRALLALQNGVSHPNLVYFGREIGGDNHLNAGEQADLTVFLKNFWEDAGNVTAAISSLDTHITVISGNASFGNIANGEIKGNQSPFVIQASMNTPPGEYAFEMHFESDAGAYSKDFTFYLRVYNRISQGFPVSLAEPIAGEPKIADLDGDGRKEMVVLTANGKVYRVNGDGSFREIYSVFEQFWAAPALGDLDGDGDLEIAFTTGGQKLRVIHHDGSNFFPFPVIFTQQTFNNSPILADVDGDHDLEIVVAGEYPAAPNIFCIEADGFIKWSAAAGLPVSFNAPATGDYNHDGQADIFCLAGFGAPGTFIGKIIIYNGQDGAVLGEVNLPGSPAEPLTIGDVNGDTYLDILVHTSSGEAPLATRIQLIDGFTLQTVWQSSISEDAPLSPIIDSDPNSQGLEFLSTLEKTINLHNYQGTILYSNPALHNPSSLVVGDLNSDGFQEILSASPSELPGNEYLTYLEIFDRQLIKLPLLELQSENEKTPLPPIINDFDNDGNVDITVVFGNGDIYCYPLDYPYKSNAHHWPEVQRDMFNSKRYDPPALSGPLPGNTAIEWSGTVRVSGDVTVPATSILNIAPGTKIIFQHGDDEKAGESPTMPELRVYGTLNANGTESNPIEFFSYSRWYGIVADGNSRVNLNYCWIDKAQRGVYIKPGSENPLPITHTFNHCEISRGQYGIYSTYKKLDVSECRIHHQTFAGIYCAVGEANIQNSEISHNPTGVYLFESTFAISGNNIFDNGDYGIDVSNCAKGSITANLLQYNSTNAGQPENPSLAAIRLFNSAAKIYGNQVLYNQENGLLLLRESFPALQETNLLLGNGPSDGEEEPVLEKAEILIEDVSAPYMGGGHNDIVDERPHAGYLMIHTGEVHGLIDVTSNYWGGEGPVERLYPLEYYDYEPWDPLPNSGGGLPKTPGKGPASGSFAKTTEDSSAQLFAQALSAEDQEDYLAAKALYLQILSAYPDSMETLYSLPRLLACELALNGDFAALQSFYTTFSQNVGDTLCSKIADNLARRCQVRQELFNEAIVGYEAIVQQPPSLADSVYAVIDVGEIYLLQEELGNAPGASKTKGGGKSAAPAMGELKPLSREQFERTKAELLALLRLKGKKEGAEAIPQVFALQQNYPNPFNPATTIKYDLPKPAKIKLEIFNILGQRVITLFDGQQAAGFQRMVVLHR